MLRSLVSGVAVCTMVACQPMRPPAPPAPRTAMPVSASFGKTWDVVISIFADRNIPIKTVDRSSGLIVAERQSVSIRADSLADCGTDMFGQANSPNVASWNVLVRGDSAQSTVKATVLFGVFTTGTTLGGRSNDSPTSECSSKGSWEAALERQVKDAAEGRSASR